MKFEKYEEQDMYFLMRKTNLMIYFFFFLWIVAG